jgi:hypothetical protein
MKKSINKNYKILFLILLPVLLFFFLPDFTSYPKSLEPIFEQAGSNQSELKKVLKHYSHRSSDSLKLKAAIFLIENMDAHHSYVSDQWEECQVELDTLFKKEREKDKLKHGFDSIYKKYDLSEVRYISDLRQVKASFLIRCIDYAFEKWKTTYAKYLNFDEFCEYILPYRVGNEPLVNWQQIFNEQYIPELFSEIKKSKDSITSVDICEALRILKDGYLHYPASDVPDYNVHMLLAARVAACRQYCLKTQLAARCLGIPVVLDYTPQWATRSMGHEWNALITKDGKALSFGIKDKCKLGIHIELVPDRIPPKVYRQTFAKQKESLSMLHGNEEIPPTFASPCMRDVTKDYYSTVDVPVKFNLIAPEHNRFAYLAVFNNKSWIPISWAKMNEGKAVFKDLHKGILCLPGYYFQKQFMPSAYPVIIDSLGKISEIRVDLNKKQTLVLSRKYQTSLMNNACESMVGGIFQASNDSNFANAVDLYKIEKKPDASYQILKIKEPRTFKYVRYLAPKQSPGNLAELEVYESGSKTKLNGKIMGGYQKKPDTAMINFLQQLKIPLHIRKQKPEMKVNCQIVSFQHFVPSTGFKFLFPLKKYGCVSGGNRLTISNQRGLTIDQIKRNTVVLPDTCYANSFDGNPLTNYCRYDMEYTWVGLEFDSPKRIDKIIYLPRNDDNCIRDGELYELFYWDNKWISLGQQTGSNETYKLTYINAPVNALFLLRNLTKGVEERIFTYEGGKQVWW